MYILLLITMYTTTIYILLLCVLLCILLICILLLCILYSNIYLYYYLQICNIHRDEQGPTLANQHARYCAYCHFPALLTPLWLIGHWQAICRTTCYPSNVVRATSGVERFACHVVLMDEPAHSL